jgi:hypothetical protein
MPHVTHEELNKRIAEAGKQVKLGGLYRHYKFPDRDYLVEKICIQEESEKVCIIYRNTRESDAPSFVRDLDSWLETVEWEGKIVPRFVPLKK